MNSSYPTPQPVRYLIIGAGGTGGSIAGFLTLGGKDVCCVARGAHLEAIQNQGLRLMSDIKGLHTLPVKACTESEYSAKADVIFVCVKGYSLPSIIDLLQRAAHADTLIVPILNGYGTGDKLERMTGLRNIVDGCIYIVSYISAPGEITQMGPVFRLIFGPRPAQIVPSERLEAIQTDCQASGIRTIVSSDIRRDTFIKWSFISAMACTGAYHHATMGALQRPGPERDTFTALSNESTRAGRSLGLDVPGDQTEKNLQIIDALAPESTASMQKDLALGRPTEINELLFDMLAFARRAGVDTPVYQRMATGLRV
jgi:2-dehydropantoate 2-reductase